jgi:poly(3-hydroxybutyrate) depolymerase
VHIAFHGCLQSAATVGAAFYEGAGYNAVADRNRLIVLYPQVGPGTLPFDPFACWDFWGYAGAADFHTRSGVQMKSVRAMLARLGERPQRPMQMYLMTR